MVKTKTEDQVRNEAGTLLGFPGVSNSEAEAGVGQITTFSQLGFRGVRKKPDGWYLPVDKNQPAIILETKAEKYSLNSNHETELLDNCIIAQQRYKNVVGLLYNGQDVWVYKNNVKCSGLAPDIQHYTYYLQLFAQSPIDKQKIYTLTKRINDCLHRDFGIKNLYHRMIFTACALVAKRYGAVLTNGMDFGLFKASILSTLSKSLQADKKHNQKLDLLLDVYSEIKMNSSSNQQAIDDFILWVTEISDCINSNNWSGEDVMGIFFNEFNRYKRKSESGQVFTPDHITSFMYRILGVNKDDVILDAACGSGAFLVKAMSNMMNEAGGPTTTKAKQIKQKQLYGIEFDREIYALACANMLIHKDGKTNLEQMDSRSDAAAQWIKKLPITKVMMNPPFESKYGCLVIVLNVLDNVPKGTLCGFIMPDKKLEKDKKYAKKILKNHTLLKIIKLPVNLFPKQNTAASIFVFEAGNPHAGKPIFGCYIEDDGLVTIKNQGRHDINNRWPDLEDYWANVVYTQAGDTTCQSIDSTKSKSYQLPEKPFVLSEEDFRKTAMDYAMFKRGIDAKEFGQSIMETTMYSASVFSDASSVTVVMKKGTK